VLEENRWLGQEKKRKSSRGWRLYEQRLDSPEKLNRESWDYHLYYQVFAFDFADLFGNIRLTMNQILIQGESLLFFSLPFLAMSDRVFSFQINGFNVRYAQIVLIFLVLSRFLNVVQTDRQRIFSLIKNGAFKALVFLVIPQVLLLGTRILPQLTAIKLCWILLNIGGVIILSEFSNSPQRQSLIKGILASVFFNSVIIAIDWVLIAFGKGDALIGFAQLGNGWSRPHAFYYEPSYVSSAVALTVPFFLGLGFSWRQIGLLFFTLCLVGARTGLLFSGFYCLLLCFLKRSHCLVIIKAILLCVTLLSFLALTPKSSNYFSFVFGVLGPVEATKRAGEKTSSEGGRIQQVLEELKIWRQSPIWGSGITLRGGERHGLDPLATNCWAEVLSEWGLVGFFSVAWILLFLFRGASLIESKIAILVHALVNLNFTQTLPRLDFWIILFALMYLKSPAPTENPK